MEDNWYNTYTSITHSTAEKSLYMAFNSNTGSPCRLRLKSETKSDGRLLVSLGTNEKYALFFPVRNISLPDGMTVTSLEQLGKRIPFEKNNVKLTGCAPRCPKLSDQSIKETSSNRASSKEKPKRKNKCPCLSSETPAQGGGNVERCRGQVQCRPNSGQHTAKSHGESSSSNIATGSGRNQLQRSQRLGEKESRNLKRVTPENSSASQVNLLSDGQARLNPINRSEIDPPLVKWAVDIQRPKTASGKTKKKTTHRQRSPQQDPKKQKNRPAKNPNVEDRSLATSLSKQLKARTANGGAPRQDRLDRQDRQDHKDHKDHKDRQDHKDRPLRLPTHNRDDSRLIRHRYRKIRAHPELAFQLDDLRDQEY